MGCRSGVLSSGDRQPPYIFDTWFPPEKASMHYTCKQTLLLDLVVLYAAFVLVVVTSKSAAANDLPPREKQLSEVSWVYKEPDRPAWASRPCRTNILRQGRQRPREPDSAYAGGGGCRVASARCTIDGVADGEKRKNNRRVPGARSAVNAPANGGVVREIP